jgi:hypothetical protein
LARASACHAEGRGFESLQPLHSSKFKSDVEWDRGPGRLYAASGGDHRLPNAGPGRSDLDFSSSEPSPRTAVQTLKFTIVKPKAKHHKKKK